MCWNPIEPLNSDEVLQEYWDQDYAWSNEEASAPFTTIERSSAHNTRTVIREDKLGSKCSCDNQQKELIVEEAFKYVFVMYSDFLAVYFIEDLQKYESVENRVEM